MKAGEIMGLIVGALANLLGLVCIVALYWTVLTWNDPMPPWVLRLMAD
jgi:hypothetical protein